ncbi:citramalate synthase [Aquibaculum arenosum]|uniref:Citramalate synthase n=1 Tax=Aquibaculum arenosum TaxID=3032591 RepID=A0ABT5YJP9_9PROT|nr:citramalate synthase [Fodinicurvata sp. CAU 1616]MDF2095165.1 citramalate synthase [Fodinicurvata sp. CAU 1616]
MSDDRRIHLFDSTLRDGAQTQGVDFTVSDKTAIAEALDRLGVSYIEGGWPGANPTDDAFFAEPPELKAASLVAFGMTRRPGRSAENDPGLSGLVNAKAPVACIVGKTWDFHVDLALEISHEENLAMIADSIAQLGRSKREVMFDAEHFFDGFKANKAFALACLRAASEAGAAWLVLCDTNGGTLPDDVRAIVAEVRETLPEVRIGIHAHDDTGNAVANSLAAVAAGARQIQGTLNGLGERCGNANLISLVGSLALKTTWDCGIDAERLRLLTPTSRLLDERLNRTPTRGAPYVGESAFAHKGGLHVSAVAKDPRTYEHVPPETVGNRRHVVVSDQAGRANVLTRLQEVGVEVDPKDPKVGRLIEEVKRREYEGYAYDGAEASFELMARRLLDQVPDYFSLNRFRVMDDRRWNARGELVTESEATVTLTIGSDQLMTVANGNGPVDALDKAVRKALIPRYPVLERVRLLDYKVRILTPQDGTEAVTRVMIESGVDRERWTTVGVSPNIIDASFNALYDALSWKLHNAGVEAPKG